MEAKRDPRIFEPWVPETSGESGFRDRSPPRPAVWLGSLPGERRGFSPIGAGLAEWPNHGGEAKTHPCPDCGKSYGFPGVSEDHQRSRCSLSASPGCRPLPLSPSGDGSLPKPGLGCPGEAGIPKPLPAPPGEKVWACPWCQQRFRLQVNLLIHQSTHLEAGGELGGPDRLACRFCPRRFGRSDHLLRHQMSHTGARPYQCPSCEKSFTDKSKLTNHYRTHTGERPFRCAACGKHFIRRHHLAKHQRTHTRERPHQCHVCLKGFMQKHHLQKHIRTHTGEKPYRCSQCPKAFSSQQRLLLHCCAPTQGGTVAEATGGVSAAAATLLLKH